jgi:SAM-dependent methyltransferase
VDDVPLRDLLVCPVCRGGLEARDDPPLLRCPACAVDYPIVSGVPILRPRPATAGASDHKRGQVEYFDQDPGDDFGVVRPRTAPELYGRLLRDKFRRSIIGLEELVPGSTALVICGGSGLDAEFLVDAGARVILSDISLGVLEQARERSRRFGLGFELVVADAEALPFTDSAVDLVYVHDGLHHLEEPVRGLDEMTRVARRGVSISEPARSTLTRGATHLGWAEESEAAGNRVARLRLDEVTAALRDHGFRPVAPHRYLMFYRHWPGRAMRLLSRPLVLPVVLAGLKIANGVLGRFGNKLVVQAVRVSE